MLVKRLIPLIPLRNGRAAQGGRFTNLRDPEDPVLIATHYVEEGADEIFFFDTSASDTKKTGLLNVLERTAEKLPVPLGVGGGIRSLTEIKDLLKSGADRVALHPTTAQHLALVRKSVERFGAPRTSVLIEVLRPRPEKRVWRLAPDGRNSTQTDAVAWAKRIDRIGVGEILVTSHDRKGTRQGYDIELIRAIHQVVRAPVIPSGGAGHPDHILKALTDGGAEGAMAASMYHSREFSTNEVKEYLWQYDVPVRL